MLEIGVLDCNNYRPFWLTWEGGKIRFGRGLEVDIDMILSYDEPCPFAIHNIELSADQGVTVEWKIYPSGNIYELLIIGGRGKMGNISVEKKIIFFIHKENIFWGTFKVLNLSYF